MENVTAARATLRPAGRTLLRLGLLILLPAAYSPVALHPLRAQEPGEVVELKGDDVTPERLIEILAPRGGTRGIGVATAHPSPPRCKIYHARLTRGIGLEPVAAVPTIPVHFGFNSSEIAPHEAPLLDALGRALASEQLAAWCFSIEGHTDSVGSHNFNDRLSRRRAEAVVRYLTERFGLEPQRLVAVGRGKRVPVADNGSDEGRQRNRRVQILNLGAGDQQP